MQQALVVVTWAGNIEKTFPSFIQSLGEYRRYPLVVVVNESKNLPSETREFLAANYLLLENRQNLWECGAIASVMYETDFDEFVLLQDTMVINNPGIITTMFDNFPDQSVVFGARWACFLGKYRRTILEQIKLPITRTKEQSMYWEVQLPNEYLKFEPEIPMLFQDWGDNQPENKLEERFGRQNLLIYNPYILKYKGTVASDQEGHFATTTLTWMELQKIWEETGSYYGDDF